MSNPAIVPSVGLDNMTYEILSSLSGSLPFKVRDSGLAPSVNSTCRASAVGEWFSVVVGASLDVGLEEVPVLRPGSWGRGFS